jgi:hypothetical protein
MGTGPIGPTISMIAIIISFLILRLMRSIIRRTISWLIERGNRQNER